MASSAISTQVQGQLHGLRCSRVSARHGSLTVCRDICLEVVPGEVVALIGPNGAGKTSFVGAVNGTVASVGEVHLAGRGMRGLPANLRARMGLATVPDDRGLFPTLTVAENIRLGAQLAPASERQTAIEDAVQGFPSIRARWNNLAGSLSGGEQQMLAIARCLAGRPRAMLLDEPSQGLAPIMVDELAKVLSRLRGSGLPILLVEQNHGLVEAVADRFAVMVGGKLVMTGGRDELADRDRIVQAYMARRTDAKTRTNDRRNG